MTIQITTRKSTLTDSFKERINKKLRKLDRFFPEEATANVVVSTEKERETVEITIKYRNMIFRSQKTASEMIDALEAVVDSLVKQIVKNKTKLSKRLRDNAFDANLYRDEEGDAPQPEEDFRIVKNKRFSIKPMDVQEAILQMNMLQHAFFMFRDSATGQVSVVYRRSGGDYGLIEPEME